MTPLTENSQLNGSALPTPKKNSHVLRGYEAPEGEIEAIVARIWAEAFQVERVGRRDDFFDLGGSSLLAVQVAVRLRQTLGVELGLRDVFGQPVLSDFCTTNRDRETTQAAGDYSCGARGGSVPACVVAAEVDGTRSTEGAGGVLGEKTWRVRRSCWSCPRIILVRRSRIMPERWWNLRWREEANDPAERSERAARNNFRRDIAGRLGSIAGEIVRAAGTW